ncbi:hypothetical protein PHET_05816 [Paragonimus heterotremus]|uniref:Kinesin motor domain-containing protein n=1 Tax=Paragonimus heterotremus TaxID=100268 RepID=A0A8J4TF61_9TREM|nr:hypothetical protein PHET_05816 [Paragonimus heterotremus]
MIQLVISSWKTFGCCLVLQRSPSKPSGTSASRLTDRGSRRNSPQLPGASSVKNSPQTSRRTSPRISPMMGVQRPSGSSSPRRLTSISSRTSPQMYNGGSSPSSLTAKHSSDDLRNGIPFRSSDGAILRPSDFHTSSLTIKANGSESPTGKNDLDPQDYNPKEPFDLVVAGICDANEKNYFPLQEKIIYLENKLLDVTLQLHRLQEEHRIMRVSHYHLDQTIKDSQLVARDQVVFENLKLNFNLVSAELEEARKLIRELRQLGWENLPQRVVLECRRAHEQVEELRRHRDMALHEHSAAKGIASEALKQVKVLKRSLEDHKKMSDQLMMREHEAEEKYTQALKTVNQQWEEKLLQRHYRDKRRQQHLSYMLEEERELAEDRDPAELEDIAFRANLVFKYPTLVECVEDATHVRGRDLGAISDGESEKSWHVASKVSYRLSEHLIEDANRATVRGKRTGSFAPTKFGALMRSVSKSIVDLGEGQSITMGDDATSLKDNPPTDAERAAWEHVKMQMRRKLEEKDDEIRRLRNQIKPLEDDLADLKTRTFTEYQMEEQIKALDEENEILVEHYLSEMVLRKKYLNELQDLKGQIRVYCRIRPALPGEESRKNPVVVYTPDQYTVLVKVSRGLKVFQYDRVFTSGATQNDVFCDVADLVQSVVDGYNVCVFVYGETGSGKSFTLNGDRDQPGLVPRMINRLFELLENPLFRTRCYSDVSITLLDLYGNKFMDLLVDYAEHMDMDIKPDQNGIMQVQGTVRKHVGCAAEFHELYHKGLAVRHTVETRSGITSAKSHLIVTVSVMTTNKMSKTTYYGKITFIKLAGSDRNVKPGSNGEITREFQAINDSLSTLGDVITGLYLAQSDVPYGNSKLTTLMQDSLGGNAKTLMIVNVNETEAHMAETLNSLNYASRLKTVKNTPERISNVEQVTRLRMTTERLKRGETNAC